MFGFTIGSLAFSRFIKEYEDCLNDFNRMVDREPWLREYARRGFIPTPKYKGGVDSD